MKREDYNSILDMLVDPDQTADGIKQLNDQLLKDESEYVSLIEQNNSLRKKNNELTLSSVQKVDVQEKPAEPQPGDIYNELIVKHFHVYNGNDNESKEV